MTPRDPQQITALKLLLGPSCPSATDELVRQLCEAVRDRNEHGHDRADEKGTSRAAWLGERSGRILRRLLDVEERELTFRTVVARFISECDQGDELTAGDLVWMLTQAGFDFRPEVEELTALATAEAEAGAMR